MKRSFHVGPDTVVQTAEGKLRGFFLDDLYIFRGIKYADAERFQAPVPPAPWEGVKDATNYGYICPISAGPMPTGEILIPHRFWPANEHCQYLNIWTPALDSAAKKPVMVWLHGGGFSDGSSIEQVAYEGDSLALGADTVVVTLNHRLNILGFLDMSSFGEKYLNSVNAGMADIVEALRWIRRNIAAFGGDPNNVTVFGQSGGGGKISALLQIPEAAGLFHKAILMSGVFESDDDAGIDHRPYILEMMKELGIPEDKPEKLEKVPYAFLIRAYSKVALKKLREEDKLISWGPVANSWYLGDPMKVGFSDHAKIVPTMAGSVFAEFSFAPGGAEDLTEAEKAAFIEKTWPGHGEELIALFKKAYPGKDLSRLLRLDIGCRRATRRFIEEKARVSSAPAYLYLFAPEFDVDGLRPAWHCSDIPFVFRNTERVPCCSNTDADTLNLETQVSGAWAAFARTGDPNGPALPQWSPYTDDKKTTMIFDQACRAADDYDRELVETIRALTPPMSLRGMALKMLEASETDEGSEWIY